MQVLEKGERRSSLVEVSKGAMDMCLYLPVTCIVFDALIVAKRAFFEDGVEGSPSVFLKEQCQGNHLLDAMIV